MINTGGPSFGAGGMGDTAAGSKGGSAAGGRRGTADSKAGRR